MTKFLFILFRGLRLFGSYARNNLLSLLALFSVFLILHIAFAAGEGITRFTAGAIRFDTIRIYPAGTGTQAMEKLEADIATLDGIASVKPYTSEETKKYIAETAATVEGLNELPADLFPPFIEVKLSGDNITLEKLEEKAAEIYRLENIESVSYGQEWAADLYRGKNAVLSLMSICMVLFAMASAVIIYQTISVSLYRYRRETYVYNLVGGTNFFITMPFVVMAGCMGLLCALLSLSGYWILHRFLIVPVETAIGITFSISATYKLLFTAAATVIAVLAGFISTQVFLRSSQSINEE